MYGTPRVGEPEGPDVEGGAVDGASVGWTVVGDALGTGTVGREVLGSSVGAAVEGAVVGIGVGDAVSTVGQTQGNAGVPAEAQMGSSSTRSNARWWNVIPFLVMAAVLPFSAEYRVAPAGMS